MDKNKRELLDRAPVIAARATADQQAAGSVEAWKLQFLTDVVTAAGLLSHGRTSKALAQRIADDAYKMRSSLFDALDSRAQPVAAGELLDALRKVSDAALYVTNAAYNLGQSHEQWPSIKARIAELDDARRRAHAAIAAYGKKCADSRPEPRVSAEQWQALYNAAILSAESAEKRAALAMRLLEARADSRPAGGVTDLGICERCNGSGEGVASTTCTACNGDGADHAATLAASVAPDELSEQDKADLTAFKSDLSASVAQPRAEPVRTLAEINADLAMGGGLGRTARLIDERKRALEPAQASAPEVDDKTLQVIIEAVGQARNQQLSPVGTLMHVRRMAALAAPMPAQGEPDNNPTGKSK